MEVGITEPVHQESGSVHIEPQAKANYHHGNLRRALLDKALQVLEQEGLEKLNVRYLGKLCGVSRTAPYRHFANKEHLLAALAEMGFQRLAKLMEQAVAGVKSPPQALEALVSAYAGFALHSTALFNLLFGAKLQNKHKYPALQRAAVSVNQILQENINWGLQQGVYHGSQEVLNLTVWSFLHGFAALLINDNAQVLRADNWQSLLHLLTDTLMVGIGKA